MKKESELMRIALNPSRLAGLRGLITFLSMWRLAMRESGRVRWENWGASVTQAL